MDASRGMTVECATGSSRMYRIVDRKKSIWLYIRRHSSVSVVRLVRSWDSLVTGDLPEGIVVAMTTDSQVLNQRVNNNQL